MKTPQERRAEQQRKEALDAMHLASVMAQNQAWRGRLTQILKDKTLELEIPF